jgi:hypothetical protein
MKGCARSLYCYGKARDADQFCARHAIAQTYGTLRIQLQGKNTTLAVLDVQIAGHHLRLIDTLIGSFHVLLKKIKQTF